MDDHERIKEELADLIAHGFVATGDTRSHLESCANCTAEASKLANTVAVIKRAELLLDDLWSDENVFLDSSTPKVGLASLQVLFKIERSRNRYRSLGIVSSVAASIMLVALILAPHKGSINSTVPQTPTQGVNMSLVSEVGSGQVGKVVAQKRGWGSQLILTTVGLHDNTPYSIIVYSGAKRQLVGSWTSNSGAKITVYLATSFQANAISRITVLDSNGSTVLKSI